MALNTLWILSNVVFTVFFTIQLAHVLQGYIKPQTTRTWDEYARLEEMEFPLVIKICVIPGFNQKALSEFGYEDIFSYFVGRKDSDYYTTYGWAGHTNYTGTVKEVLERVSGYQIEEIIKQIYVWDRKDYKIDIPLKYLKVTRVNYPKNCRSLDLSKVSELNGTNYNQLYVEIRQLGKYRIEVYFSGKSLDTGRNIREHNLRSTGDDIILKNKNVPKAYMVEITQTEFVEEDPFNDCREYPNPEFASYDECDNQFMRETLPGLSPVWITEDFEDFAGVTIQKNDESGAYSKFFIQSIIPLTRALPKTSFDLYQLTIANLSFRLLRF